MSKRLGFTVVAVSFLFSSAPGVAGGRSPTSAVQGLPAGPTVRHGAPDEYASLFRQAPVGHRQPRRRDIPEATQLSPIEQELRRLDDEVDRKLLICRGC
ncbi:hypothetical protein [Bradyrhizobium elkanii]|uniref:hypothetical protein n=1 Tax=Bradyrhizobium elkanii TaxID=29448 RepID=UPI001BA804A8|nr:hypothetical protein [Bradyrhizobium elkanii]MBR1159663.1 hypothetical protein [Bradyrhizobium elkanii]